MKNSTSSYHRLYRTALATAAMVCLAAGTVHAASITWSGTTSTDFEIGSNWAGTAPANSVTTDTGVFSGVVPSNMPSLTMNRSITGLQFTTATGGWTLGGSSYTLTLGASGISTVGQTSGTNTISANLLVGAGQTWATGTGGTLQINGVVDGSSALTVGSSGNTGTLVLNNANTYAGIATISFGALRLSNANAAVNSSITNNVANGLTFGSGIGTFTISALNGTGGVTLADTGSSAVNLQVGSFRSVTGSNSGVLSGSGSVTKFGTNSQTFSGANTYSGGTTLVGGTLVGTQTSGTPFGTGAITLKGGTLSLAPGAGVTNVALSGANASATTDMTYGGGSLITLAKGTQTSVTFTAGNASATDPVLVRDGKGTLIIRASGAGLLGAASSGERFIVNGTVPTITNGMVNASIIGLGTTNTGYGDFLTYDNTDGFKVATYVPRSGSIVGGTTSSTEIANVNAAATFTGTNSVYALVKQSGAAITLTGATLNIGDGTGQAGLILNNLSGNLITGGTVNFGAAEGVIQIFDSQSYPNLTSTVLAGTGGITISSNGAGTILQLSQNNTFSGGLTINKGSVGLFTGATSDAIFGAASNVITVNGGGFNSVSSGLIAYTRSMVLGEAGATFTSSDRNMAFGGNISGTGFLVSNGATTGLFGNNTYTGGTILSGGTLLIGSDKNIGGASSAITFNGGTLAIQGTDINNFGSHAVTFNAGTNAGLDIGDAGNTFTLDRIMNQASGTFTKSGAGTLVLTKANTYTGTTTLRGGLLTVDAQQGGSLATTAATFNGGSLKILGKNSGTTAQTLGNVTLAAGGGSLIVDGNGGSGTTVTLGTMATSATAGSSLNIQTSGTTTVTSSTAADATGILGGGRVTYNGSDWATNTGANTAISGYASGSYATLATAAGTDTLNSRVTAGGTTTLATGAHVTNSLKIVNASTGNMVIGATGADSLTLTSGGLLFTGATAYSIDGPGTLKSGTATNSDLIVHQYGTGNLTINSVIANGVGASTLTKTGSGTLILTADNTASGGYTGVTYINGGTLSIAASTNLGTGAVHLYGGTLQATNSFANTRSILLGSGGGTVDVTGGNTLTQSGNLVSVLNANYGVGSFNLTSTGGSKDGLFIYSGGNQWSGAVNINDGTLRLASSSALNLVGTNSINFGASTTTGKLQMNNNSAIVSGLSSASTAAVVENNAAGAGTSTLTVTSASNSTYAGTLRNNSGSGSGILALVKAGAGTMTLSGANSYTGTTTVGGGTLLINAAHTGAGAYSVLSGGTLGGTSSITTASNAGITFASGAKLAPGASAGTLTAVLGTGVFDISAAVGGTNTGALVFELGAAGVNSDLLSLTTGVLAVGTGALEFGDFNFSTLSGFGAGTYTLIDTNSTITGSLGSTLTGSIGLYTGTLSFANSNNDLILTVAAVPEPSTYAMLAGGLAVLSFLRRRKKT